MTALLVAAAGAVGVAIGVFVGRWFYRPRFGLVVGRWSWLYELWLQFRDPDIRLS